MHQCQERQVRTLQRRIKQWRARHGEVKEVMFPQRHEPGHQAQSDFTFMNVLGVTIQEQPFPHLLYHFVLTYSNWETTTLCSSESFESLSLGLQNALWELGAVPEEHRTDRLSAAVNNNLKRDTFHTPLPGTARSLRDEAEPDSSRESSTKTEMWSKPSIGSKEPSSKNYY